MSWSKEKEYTLYLGERDRQSTRYSCPYCLSNSGFINFFFCLQCTVTSSGTWSSALLPVPPRLLRGWRDAGLAACTQHGILVPRVPATRTPGAQQFWCPWELCCPADLASGSRLLFLKLMSPKLCRAGDCCKTAPAVLSLSYGSAPWTGSS